MNIIVRAIGERTEKECIRRCSLQGHVSVVREYPFGESIRKTYKLALSFIGQKWIPVIDADVLLNNDCLKQAVQRLQDKSNNIFCWDGHTNDKIMGKNRRAGVHIYNQNLLERGLRFIDNNHIKPETNVRKKMLQQGFLTYKDQKFIFGLHDYEQYYRDLWRKAICQTKKLAKMTGARPAKWKKLARKDNDFYVIYEAYKWAKKNNPDILIDARMNFDAKWHLDNLGIEEKKEYA